MDRRSVSRVLLFALLSLSVPVLTQTTWIERSTGGNFRSITSSSDGTKLAAVVQGGNIWTSVDSGKNWVEDQSVGNTQNWHAITSSSDGTNLAAVAYGGKIWISIDSGEYWTNVGTTDNWHSITSWNDGTYYAAVSNGGSIWISVTNAAYWSEVTSVNLTSQMWGDITSSNDGAKLAACVGVPGGGCCAGNIWTSTDSGATWTERIPGGSAKMWVSITSSSNGTKLAAVAEGGNIWTSADTGATWIERSPGGSMKNWRGIASSSDGTKLAASEYGGNIWTSDDSGGTWIEILSTGSTKSWWGIASSRDGTKIAASVEGGSVWTFEGKPRNATASCGSYVILDGTSRDDTSQGCQDEYMTIPSGCAIAPRTDENIAMIAEYYWGTHGICLADGTCWWGLHGGGSAGTQDCSQGSDGFQTTTIDGKVAYMPPCCSERILLECTNSTNCTNVAPSPSNTLSSVPPSTPPSSVPPPPPPNRLIPDADYESSASRYSIMTALVVSIIDLYITTKSR